MRFIGIGVAAALALALMAPASVMAAKKPAAAAAPGGIDPKMREKGMADAPALLTRAGVTCQLADARWIGEDKKAGQNVYEVACTDGVGGVLNDIKDQPVPSFYPCIEANGTPEAPSSLACKLPANLDALAPLTVMISKTVPTCQVTKARSIGRNTTTAFYEVQCSSGDGYVMQVALPATLRGDNKSTTCLAFDGSGNINCKLSDAASQLAVVDRLAADSGKACTVSNKRYILSTKDGVRYFEAACTDGKGYVFEQGANGSLTRTIDCAAAAFVGGGCTLTDAVAAQSEQAGLYTSLVRKAGFDCDVALYAPLPLLADFKGTIDEAVELKCKNRPDGAIALFPRAGGAAIFNCAAAPAIGYRCTKTDPAQALVPINRDIAAAADKPFACKAYATGGLAMTADDILVEVGCDPEGRFAVAYSRATGKPTGTRSCASMGDKCKLPTVRKPS